MPPSSRRKRSQRPWLAILRWSLGALAMVATWGYGAWKGGDMSWLALPGGVMVMFCTANALIVPLVAVVAVAVAFIAAIDSGLVQAIRNSAAIFLAIGLVMTGWQILQRLRRRERPR